MSATELESILNQIQQLSPDDQLLLVQRVVGMLVQTKQIGEARYLAYGKYQKASGVMSTEEDFQVSSKPGTHNLFVD